MKKIEKIVWSQDSYFKTERKYSGETSINLSNDIYRFLGGEDNGNFIFTIYKEDYIKALGVLAIMLPLYNSTSKNYSICSYSNNLIESYFAIIQSKFGDSDTATYSVNLFKRNDSRIYMNQLKDEVSGFNLRNFLIQAHSKMIFIQTDEGSYEIRLESNYADYSLSANYQSYKPIENYVLEQKIYFGTPGSGKSWAIKKKYEMKMEGDEYVIDEEKIKRVVRTTFHPDTDYAQFVGCYKPTKDKEDPKIITYEFVPQAFTDAYIKAWRNLHQPYYLIIEEINRGNCAQIFGDLFQLLDRNKNGYSEYPIKADQDLRIYLEEQLTDDSEGIKDGKLCLPPNLSIIASMNTSDQSLFPMDSAFKRRWNWEYVPIKYEGVKSSEYKINIPNSSYEKWVDFLKKINKIILEKTDSEDKQMGNFFIKGDIDAQEFKDKVMFYLWSEVCKDLYNSNENFFRAKMSDSENLKEFSYNELYDDKDNKLLIGFLKYIKEFKLKNDLKA